MGNGVRRGDRRPAGDPVGQAAGEQAIRATRRPNRMFGSGGSRARRGPAPGWRNRALRAKTPVLVRAGSAVASARRAVPKSSSFTWPDSSPECWTASRRDGSRAAVQHRPEHLRPGAPGRRGRACRAGCPSQYRVDARPSAKLTDQIGQAVSETPPSIRRAILGMIEAGQELAFAAEAFFDLRGGQGERPPPSRPPPCGKPRPPLGPDRRAHGRRPQQPHRLPGADRPRQRRAARARGLDALVAFQQEVTSVRRASSAPQRCGPAHPLPRPAGTRWPGRRLPRPPEIVPARGRHGGVGSARRRPSQAREKFKPRSTVSVWKPPGFRRFPPPSTEEICAARPCGS